MRKASRLGFDAIELFTPGMLDQPKQKLKEYVKLSTDLGIELQYCTGLAPDCDLASQEEAIRRNGIEHIKKTLELIAFMGGKLFGGVNYIAWGSKLARLGDKPAYRERSLTSIREVVRTAEDLGITYCIEPTNRFEQFLLNTSPEANAFL
ncbi:MAG: TIM barrel protein, partial [Armatimonadetes bacterium]|nr:TIM barrel protein [Armatimonadota bacterium]